MKKNIKKRIISVVLVLCMLLTPTFSISANAGIFDFVMGIAKNVKDTVDTISGYIGEGKEYYDKVMERYDQGKKIYKEVEKFAQDPITYILDYINGSKDEKGNKITAKNAANPKYYSLLVNYTQRLGYSGKFVISHETDSKGGKVKDSDYHKLEEPAKSFDYYVNGSRSPSGTLGTNKCTAWFDRENLTLYLHNYDGGPIGFLCASETLGYDGKPEKDRTLLKPTPGIFDVPLNKTLTIVLKGTNRISETINSNAKKDAVGICHVGAVYITSDDGGTLTINSSVALGNEKDAFGIVAAQVDIRGNANVTINVSGPNVATGIRVFDDGIIDSRISVRGKAKLTVNAKSIGSGSETKLANGIQAEDSIYFQHGSAGGVNITCSSEGTGKTYPIYGTSGTLIHFMLTGLVRLQWDKDKGSAMYGDPPAKYYDSYAIQTIDKSNSSPASMEYRGSTVVVPNPISNITINDIEMPVAGDWGWYIVNWRPSYKDPITGYEYLLGKEYLYSDMTPVSGNHKLQPETEYILRISVHLNNTVTCFINEIEDIKITANTTAGTALPELKDKRNKQYTNRISFYFKFTIPGKRSPLSYKYDPSKHDILGGNINEELREGLARMYEGGVQGGSGQVVFEVIDELPEWLNSSSFEEGRFRIGVIDKYLIPYKYGDGESGKVLPEKPYAASKATVRVTDVITRETVEFTINIGEVVDPSSSMSMYSNVGYNIPMGAAGTAIDVVDIKNGAKGGSAPYTFSKSSGPSWLNVSSDGKISGTRPNSTQEETIATISVRDANNTTKTITIHIGEVFIPEISVDPNAPIENDGSFNDVPATAWYTQGVNYVFEKGLMNGVGGNNFAPDNTLTRAMLVTILYRNVGSPNMKGEPNQFIDVPAGEWYTDAVIWASTYGLVNGIGGGKYGPNDPITREQLAVIIHRLQFSENLSLADKFAEKVYSDNGKISEYAKSAVKTLTIQGLFRDIPLADNKFNPQSPATRAEVAVVLHRFLEAVEGEPYIPPTTEPKPTEPAPTEPKPTEPTPTEPTPTEPAPTEPTPTEPKPTEPAPTEPPAAPGGLTFTKQASYDIPAGSRYTAISTIHVSDGISGGTAPYTFSKVSGPDWLRVSSAGVLSGSRQSAAPATTAVIQVTDTMGATATITINIGEVK